MIGPAGKRYIEGRRITVDLVVDHYINLGWSLEEVAERFDLSLAQIHTALAYYYEHQEQIDEEMRALDKALEGYPTGQEFLERLKVMMTTHEVAETFGISDRTVREAIQKGWIKARKSGGTWLIRQVDAEKRWGSKK